MADRFRKLMNAHVGPGGINCPCCAHGKHKDRTQFYTQAARRELKAELIAEINEAFDNEYHVDDADYFAENYD